MECPPQYRKMKCDPLAKERSETGRLYLSETEIRRLSTAVSRHSIAVYGQSQHVSHTFLTNLIFNIR